MTAAFYLFIHTMFATQMSFASDTTCNTNLISMVGQVMKDSSVWPAKLELIKKCSGKKGFSIREIEKMAVSLFQSMEKIQKTDLDSEKNPLGELLSRMVKDLFEFGAKSGDPSLQHNYASFHNPDPRSPTSRYQPNDYATYMYWTRKAAAQGEPRSAIDLAERLLDGVPSMNIAADPLTACILERCLSLGCSVTDPYYKEPLEDWFKNFRGRVKKVVSEKILEKCDKSYKTFSFRTLNPD